MNTPIFSASTLLHSSSWRRRFAGATLALAACALSGPAASAHTYGMQTSNYNDRPTLQATIQNLTAAHTDITEMATTPSGEWIIVAGQSVSHSANFPSDCLSKVFQYISMNLEIDVIAFAPNSSWMVIAEHLAWHSAGVPDVALLETKILDRIGVGARLNELAFDSDGSGWTLISGDWAYSTKVPSDLYAAIVERHASKRPIEQVSIATDGRWVLLADDWFASSGLNSSAFNWLKKWQREQKSLDRMMLGLGGNWVITSNGAYVPDMSPGIEAVEYSIEHDGTTDNIWQRMEDLNIAGVSMAIVEDGKVKWARGYGELEAGTQRFVRSTSPFDTASLSKFAAAATLMTLVDDLSVPLGLDSNVGDVILAGWQQGNPIWSTLFTWLYYGPYYANAFLPLPYQDITLRRLLSHTASMVPHGSTSYKPGDAMPATVQMLFGHNSDGSYGGSNMTWYDPFLKNDGVPHTPGTVWDYSGGGFMVAQAMGEELTGETLAQTAQSRLLGPLGMTNSTFVAPLPPALLNRAAVPHDSNGVALAPADRKIYPWAAAGGMWTTPTDYAQIMLTVMNMGVSPSGQQLLTPTACQQILSDQAPGSTRYGLGVSLSKNDVTPGTDGFFAHNGAHSNAAARMGGHPTREEALVVFINGGHDDADGFREEIYATFKTVYGW